MPNRREKQFKHWREDQETRQIRNQLKRRPKHQRDRKSDWTPEYLEDLEMYDELYEDYPQDERIVPRGEMERRKQALAEARAAVQEREADTAPASPAAMDGERGIVIEVSTGLCRVELDGDELVCSLRGTLGASGNGFTNAVAVGDRVIVSRNGAQQGTVEAVLPRRGLFTRPDTYNAGHRVVDRGRQQLIAANVDQLLIVASWRQPHLWPELIDRYLITAQRNGVTPIICVNKVDLAADMAECRAALAPYVDLGYRVIFTSALTGKGVGRLRKALSGRTTVLAGLSGVGKSSLLTAVQPRFTLRTSEVSERSGEGRHTTTQVNLWRLDGGGFVIDTPGIREFGLAGLLPEELLRFYPDLVAAQQECRFANCSHTHEPDCGVKAAVEAGRLSPVRYHSYVKIYQELSG